MNTVEEQLAFFDARWEGMKQAAESGGGEAVIRFIDGFEDARERRVLFFFCRRGLLMNEWQNKNLDAYIRVAQEGIARFLKDAEAADDDEGRRARTNMANILSYNLTSGLADCWPDDDTPREKQHFEAGLKAAEDCVRWRQELGNPPMTHSMAWWAKGMHELSLGRAADAATSWVKSLDHAKEASELDGKPTEVGPGGEFGINLGHGYVGLGTWAAGDETGRKVYEEAVAAFTAQLGSDETKDDAQFGLDQLGVVKTKYVDA